MSRKHFQSIADAVKETAKDAELNTHQHYALASNMARACMEHNPRFDRETFYRACGLEYRTNLGWVPIGS
jgi:hypothetical protein